MLSSHSSEASCVPIAMPTRPSATEPARCPAPHSSVMRSVRRIDQSRARAIAMNGR